MRTRAIAAWGVHLYTGLGTVLGLLALDAVSRARYGTAFAWLAVAMFVDCTDGALARAADVKNVLPAFDGSRLDDIVDYLNYVFVPLALACHVDWLLPPTPWRMVIAAMPLLASGYGFCQADAKTPDHFFKGFPSYWNVVVLYLYCLALPAWINAAILLVFAVLVFVPLRYLYPSRTRTGQSVTIALGAVWAVLVVVLLLQFPQPSRTLAAVSLFFPVYYIGVSVYLHLRTNRAPGH